jgi:ubiquinone/menaquinone biosynthesis C-methylase UbiE
MTSNIRAIPVHPIDKETADAFATSWNNLPDGSVYTREQFEDWFSPIGKKEVEEKTVLELGCGNGSLLTHLPKWRPQFIEGVDLGDSILSCKKNMYQTGFQSFKITRADLIDFESDGFDLVYSIGVLHHLKEPSAGFKSVVRNTKPGGKFHCWVYAKEGNWIIINMVDPIRRIASRLPWWITKYFVATPLVLPFFLYAKVVSKSKLFAQLPLHEYSCWIANREFSFFRHVAFDQLVTPQTTYISKETIETWLRDSEDVEENSSYLIFRNGNSWKFGGLKKCQH